MNQDEVFSKADAEQMISSMNDIVESSIKKFENAHDTLITKLAANWADKFLVDDMGKYQKNLKGFASELNKNTQTFADIIKNVADGYAIVGGEKSSGVSSSIRKVSAEFSVDKIKESFSDGRKGLKATSASTLLASIDAFKATLKGIKASTKSEIKGILAFGNKNVQNKLGDAADKIIEIFSDHVDQSNKDVGNYFEKRIRQYVKMGNMAESAAAKTAGSGGK